MNLSIIIALSDNYDTTKKLTSELNTTLGNIFLFTKNTDITLEVVVINWNIIEDKNSYKKLDLLNKPQNVVLKYYEINNDIHNNYPLSHKIPFYFGHAINLGIQKSKANAILTMKNGTFFTKDSWNEILKHISEKNYVNNFLTLCSKAKLDESILQNKQATYNTSTENIQKYFIQELKNKELIDYKNKRVYLNKERAFSLFDSFLFSREKIEKLRGFPELSIYPLTPMIERFFSQNMKNLYQEHLTLSATCKIFYKETKEINPSLDIELQLAPNTEQIILDRIAKEQNPVIFNDENWGLRNIELNHIVL